MTNILTQYRDDQHTPEKFKNIIFARKFNIENWNMNCLVIVLKLQLKGLIDELARGDINIIHLFLCQI